MYHLFFPTICQSRISSFLHEAGEAFCIVVAAQWEPLTSEIPNINCQRSSERHSGLQPFPVYVSSIAFRQHHLLSWATPLSCAQYPVALGFLVVSKTLSSVFPIEKAAWQKCFIFTAGVKHELPSILCPSANVAESEISRFIVVQPLETVELSWLEGSLHNFCFSKAELWKNTVSWLVWCGSWWQSIWIIQNQSDAVAACSLCLRYAQQLTLIIIINPCPIAPPIYIWPCFKGLLHSTKLAGCWVCFLNLRFAAINHGCLLYL